MRLILFSFLLLSFQSQAELSRYVPPHAIWADNALEVNIPVEILYSIALAESGKTIKGQFIPHPYAIAVGKEASVGQLEHQGFYPNSKTEALLLLESLLTRGHRNIGIGMMQLNIKANPDIVDDYATLLDPEINLKAALKVIKWCARHKTIDAILACYSHGKPDSEKGLAYAGTVRRYRQDYGQYFVSQIKPGQLTYAQLLSIFPNRSTNFKIPNPVSISSME